MSVRFQNIENIQNNMSNGTTIMESAPSDATDIIAHPHHTFGAASSSLPCYRPQVALQNFSVHYFVGRDVSAHDDMLIHRHGNGVCAIALAPFHKLLMRQHAPALASLSFRVNGHDYAQIDVSGKRKRGAQTVEAQTIIAEVAEQTTSEPSVVHRIRAAVPHGMLIEANDIAVKTPQLLATEPEGRGWICMMLAQDLSRVSRDWLSPAEYFKLRTSA
jgi:hypothetical protein